MSGWSPWTKGLMEVSDCCGTGTSCKGVLLDKSEALLLLHSKTQRRSRLCSQPTVALAVDVLIEFFFFFSGAPKCISSRTEKPLVRDIS